MTPAQASDAVLSVLRDRGWWQATILGYGTGPGGQVCLGVAANIALGATEDRSALSRRLNAALRHLAPAHPGDFVSWNDDPATTFADVTLLLKHAAMTP
jgi:hypothetical protein